MSNTKKQPRFGVGDRVRLISKPSDMLHMELPTLGRVVKVCSSDWLQVDFENWTSGWGDGACRYGVNPDHLAPASAARFQVVYVEDGDETFDTQEDAETEAAMRAHDDPGKRFAVLRVVASVAASTSVSFERFA